MDTGALTTETHAAVRLTCYSLVELCRYCLEELNFDCLAGRISDRQSGGKVRTVPSDFWDKLPHINAASLSVRKKAEATRQFGFARYAGNTKAMCYKI